MHSAKYTVLCRYISVLLYIACVVYPCWVAYLWYQAPGVPFAAAQGYGLRLSLLPASMLHPQQLTSMVKCLGFIISWIPGAVVVYICYAAASIFRNLAQQSIFTLLHVRYLRNMPYLSDNYCIQCMICYLVEYFPGTQSIQRSDSHLQ